MCIRTHGNIQNMNAPKNRRNPTKTNSILMTVLVMKASVREKELKSDNVASIPATVHAAPKIMLIQASPGCIPNSKNPSIIR